MNISTIETEKGRFYNIGENLYPSVTTVLSKYSKPEIDKWIESIGKEKAQEKLLEASKRGNIIHSACERYLTGKEIEKKGFFYDHMIKVIINWMKNNVTDYILIESVVFSHKVKVAGKVDLIAYLNGVKTVIDFKTSTNIKTENMIENYFEQAAMYAYCYNEMFNDNIQNICIVMVDEKTMNLSIFKKNELNMYKKSFIKKRIDFNDN